MRGQLVRNEFNKINVILRDVNKNGRIDDFELKDAMDKADWRRKDDWTASGGGIFFRDLYNNPNHLLKDINDQIVKFSSGLSSDAENVKGKIRSCIRPQSSVPKPISNSAIIWCDDKTMAVDNNHDGKTDYLSYVAERKIENGWPESMFSDHRTWSVPVIIIASQCTQGEVPTLADLQCLDTKRAGVEAYLKPYDELFSLNSAERPESQK